MSFSKQIRREPGPAALSHCLATAWHPGSSTDSLAAPQSQADKPAQHRSPRHPSYAGEKATVPRRELLPTAAVPLRGTSGWFCLR